MELDEIARLIVPKKLLILVTVMVEVIPRTPGNTARWDGFAETVKSVGEDPDPPPPPPPPPPHPPLKLHDREDISAYFTTGSFFTAERKAETELESGRKTAKWPSLFSDRTGRS